MGTRFPLFGTHSSYPQGQRSGGRGERKPPLPPDYRKERWGFRGRDSSLPRVSSPCVTAYVSSFTNHLGEGSGRPSNWGRGRSPLPRFGSGANYTLTGGGGGAPSRGSDGKEKLQGKNTPTVGGMKIVR